MIRVFASNKLKQPIVLNVPEVEWEKLKKIEDKNELNHRLLQMAATQVIEHGYDMGSCKYRNKKVTLSECTACALSLGKKTKTEWEACVRENVKYCFDMQKTSKPSHTAIKDEKIAKKLMPTKTEAARQHNQFIMREELNPADIHDKNELEIIEKTRKDIQGEWDDSQK